jgi:hypothetical protein
MIGTLLVTSMAAAAPPGRKVVAAWHAWYVGTKHHLVVVKNTAPPKLVTSVNAIREDSAALRKSFFLHWPEFLYFGEQSAVELALDETCKLIAGKQEREIRYLLTPVEQRAAIEEFLDADAAADLISRHDDDAAYMAGSVLSAVAPLSDVDAAGRARMSVGAAIASCDDTPGRRFARAQQRAYHAHMRENLWAVRDLIAQYVETGLNHALTEQEKMRVRGGAMAIAIKSCRLTLERLKEYDKWLSTTGVPSGIAGKGYVAFTTRGDEETKWLSKGSIALVSKQLATLTKEYAAERQKEPVAFPEIPEKAVLTEEDFKTLFK